jgi:hypothetical protein
MKSYIHLNMLYQNPTFMVYISTFTNLNHVNTRVKSYLHPKSKCSTLLYRTYLETR